MEIERKWLVTGWPDFSLPLKNEHFMQQGYLSVHPTVRIREEALCGGETEYILCVKSSGTLEREEIEIPVSEDHFRRLSRVIGRPLIPKLRRTYELPDGLLLEVNLVDEGAPTQFWYAEIEYPSKDAALSWQPSGKELADYLSQEVTAQPSQTMGAYWVQTRLASPVRE